MSALRKILYSHSLVILFLCHLWSVLSFSHSHFIQGAWITHSHYFEKNEDGSCTEHEHTSQELIFLSMFSHLNIEITEVSHVPDPIITTIYPTASNYLWSSVVAPEELSGARAPPAMFSLA